MSINKVKDYYIEKLAENFRTNFEDKTGKKVGTNNLIEVVR